MNDPRGLRQRVGIYHSDAEWTNLANNLGGINIAGGKLKKFRNTGLAKSQPMLPIESGFADHLEAAVTLMEVLIVWVGTAFGWTATQNDALSAWYWYLGFDFESVARYDYNKENGFSVRCIKRLKRNLSGLTKFNGHLRN